MIARITTGALLCLGFAACVPQDLSEWSDEPPCPNVATQREAARIATELVRPEIGQYDATVRDVEWSDSVWRILLTDTDGRYGRVVEVRADGRVTGCGVHDRCEPEPGLHTPACEVISGTFVDKQEAAAIAFNYLVRQNLAPVQMNADSASWFGAHWRVRVVPRAPAPLGSYATVYVSPDGSRKEVTYHDGMPSRDSFLFREPAPR